MLLPQIGTPRHGEGTVHLSQLSAKELGVTWPSNLPGDAVCSHVPWGVLGPSESMRCLSESCITIYYSLYKN